MSRLNKTYSYAIKWLDSQSMEPIKIADELKLTLKQVSGVLEKSSKVAEGNLIKTKISPVTNKSTLMINETAGKKNNSVSIMTQEASAMHDERQKNLPPASSARRSDAAIFRPND